MSDRTDLRDRLYEKLCKQEDITTYNLVFKRTSRIIKTSAQRYKYQKVIKDDLKEVVLKRRLSMVIGRIIFSVIFLGIWCLMMYSFFKDGIQLDWSILFLVAMTLFIWTTIVSNLYSLTKDIQIEISSQQIRLEAKTFSWDNILDMYIVIKPVRGSRYNKDNHYLVLLLNTDELYKYSLDGYTIAAEEFTWEVSAYLEHFRNRQYRSFQ